MYIYIDFDNIKWNWGYYNSKKMLPERAEGMVLHEHFNEFNERWGDQFEEIPEVFDVETEQLEESTLSGTIRDLVKLKFEWHTLEIFVKTNN